MFSPAQPIEPTGRHVAGFGLNERRQVYPKCVFERLSKLNAIAAVYSDVAPDHLIQTDFASSG